MAQDVVTGGTSLAIEAIRTQRVVRSGNIEATTLIHLTAEALANLRSRGSRSILAVPMIRQDQVIGAISLAHPGVEAFSDNHVELLKSFADQAMIAVENVRLFEELQASNRELRTALDTQTATSDILGVISRSPTDVQPVFDAILASAVRLLGAYSGLLTRVEGDQIVLAALTSTDDAGDAALRAVFPMSVQSGGVGNAQVIRDRQPFNLADAHSDPRLSETGRADYRSRGSRSQAIVPLLRQDEAIGTIAVTRREPGGFTEEEIALLQTFAAQAVIAIENVRLFTELQASNRDLTTALDTQTATSEVLRVISGSPTDVQPVFDAIVRSALQLLGGHAAVLLYLVDGDVHVGAYTSTHRGGDSALASRYPIPVEELARQNPPLARVLVEGHIGHVPDTEELSVGDFARSMARARGHRSRLMVPLRRNDAVLGGLAVTRVEPGPFSEDEIALLQTFADQAVIAIENVRLFTELQARNHELTEALEQQTATADILRAISSSPTDLRPVLETVVHAAARFCDAPDVAIVRVDGDVLRLAAASGSFGEEMVRRAGNIEGVEFPISRASVTGRAVVERRSVHVHDLAAEAEDEYPVGRELQRRFGHRTLLATPLLREGVPVGALVMFRTEINPFSEKQARLSQIFADQAVIAIENVRLFTELEARNQELMDSLTQQTATAEILRVISSSPTDIQPVLEAVTASAARLCEAPDAAIFLAEGEELRLATHLGPIALGPIGEFAVPLVRGSLTGRSTLERRTIQLTDHQAEEA